MRSSSVRSPLAAIAFVALTGCWTPSILEPEPAPAVVTPRPPPPPPPTPAPRVWPAPLECPEGTELDGVPREGVRAEVCRRPDWTPHGPFRRWQSDPEHRPSQMGTHLDGELHGVWVAWHENGARNTIGSYRHGERDGLWMRWWEDGALDDVSDWRNGKRHGVYRSYHPTGFLHSDGRYEEGDRVGTWRVFHPDGYLLGAGLCDTNPFDVETWTCFGPDGEDARCPEEWPDGGGVADPCT